MIKNMSELCREIALREAGKSSVSIGNIREILRILADLTIESKDGEPLVIIAKYSINRAARGRRK
jgi:hypothetical protein